MFYYKKMVENVIIFYTRSEYRLYDPDLTEISKDEFAMLGGDISDPSDFFEELHLLMKKEINNV